MKPVFLLVISVLTLAFCTPKKNPQLQEAAQIHNEAIAMHKEVTALVENAKTLLPGLKAKRDSEDAVARPAFDTAIAAIEQADKKLDLWMDDVVEVPGNEAHNEHNAHEHEHNHAAPPDVTPQQMLEIQRETKKTLESIRTNVVKQTEAANKLLGV